MASPRGTDAEFAELETELEGVDNAFGVRQLADRLAQAFPASPAALRLQGFAAMRADDPAAAVRSFSAALALMGSGADAGAGAGAGKAGEERAASSRRASRARASWRAIRMNLSRNRAQSRNVMPRRRTSSTTHCCCWQRSGMRKQSRNWKFSRTNPNRRRSPCVFWG